LEERVTSEGKMVVKSGNGKGQKDAEILWRKYG
jgi:hypothetical protein